jgi:hypothetical protein
MIFKGMFLHPFPFSRKRVGASSTLSQWDRVLLQIYPSLVEALLFAVTQASKSRVTSFQASVSSTNSIKCTEGLFSVAGYIYLSGALRLFAGSPDQVRCR